MRENGITLRWKAAALCAAVLALAAPAHSVAAPDDPPPQPFIFVAPDPEAVARGTALFKARTPREVSLIHWRSLWRSELVARNRAVLDSVAGADAALADYVETLRGIAALAPSERDANPAAPASLERLEQQVLAQLGAMAPERRRAELEDHLRAAARAYGRGRYLQACRHFALIARAPGADPAPLLYQAREAARGAGLHAAADSLAERLRRRHLQSPWAAHERLDASGRSGAERTGELRGAVERAFGVGNEVDAVRTVEALRAHRDWIRAARQAQWAREGLARFDTLRIAVLEARDLPLYRGWREGRGAMERVHAAALRAARSRAPAALRGLLKAEKVPTGEHGPLALRDPRVRQGELRRLWRELERISEAVDLPEAHRSGPLPQGVALREERIVRAADALEARGREALTTLALGDLPGPFDPRRVPGGEAASWRDRFVRRLAELEAGRAGGTWPAGVRADVMATLRLWSGELALRANLGPDAALASWREAARDSLTLLRTEARLLFADLAASTGDRRTIREGAEASAAVIEEDPGHPQAARAHLLRAKLEGAGRRPDPSAAVEHLERAVAMPGDLWRREALYLLGSARLRSDPPDAPGAERALARAARMPVFSGRDQRISDAAVRLLADLWLPPFVHDPEAGSAAMERWLARRSGREAALGLRLRLAWILTLADDHGDGREALERLEVLRGRYGDHPRRAWLEAARIELTDQLEGDLGRGWAARRRLLAEWDREAVDRLEAVRPFTASRLRELLAWQGRVRVTIGARFALDRGGVWRDSLEQAASAYLERFSASDHAADVLLQRAGVTDRLANSPGERLRATGLYLRMARGWPGHPGRERALERAVALGLELEKADSLGEGDSLLSEAALGLAAARPADERTHRIVYRAARRLHERGLHELSAALFDRVVAQAADPKLAAEALAGWYDSQLRLGRYGAVSRRARLLMAQSNRGRMVSASREALSRAQYLRARDLERAGLPDRALRALEEAGGLEAEHPVAAAALFRVGVALADSGKLEPARRTFGALLQSYPGMPDAAPAAFNLARVLERLHKAGETLDRLEIARAYERAAELAPAGERAREALAEAARWYRRLGRDGDEVRVLEALLTRFPDHKGSAWTLHRLGRIGWRLGDYERAGRAYGRILRERPRSAEAVIAHIYEGERARARGEREGARRSYRAALSLHQRLADSTGAGLPGMADQARLGLAKLVEDGGGDVPEAVRAYADAANTSHGVVSVRAPLQVAELQLVLAERELDRMPPAGTPAESLAVMLDRRAARVQGRAEAAIEWAVAARTRARRLARAVDSLRALPSAGGEVAWDAFGLESDAIVQGREGEGARVLERLAARGDTLEAEAKRRRERAWPPAVEAYLALPDVGATRVDRDLYRQAVLQELVRPRLARSAELVSTEPGAARVLALQRRAALEALRLMEEMLEDHASARAGYEELLARRVPVERTQPLEDRMLDAQDGAVELAALAGTLSLEALTGLERGRLPLDSLRTAAQGALQRGLRAARGFRERARDARAARTSWADAYEREGYSVLLEAERTMGDLAQGWTWGALRSLEAVLPIPRDLGLRPDGVTGELVRQLARLDPERYAELVGLEQRESSFVTGDGVRWRTAADEVWREVAVGEPLAWPVQRGEAPVRPVTPDQPSVQDSVIFAWDVPAEGRISGGTLEMIAGRACEVYVNGEFAAETFGPRDAPVRWEMGELLREGSNRVKVVMGPAAEAARLAARLTVRITPPVTDDLEPVFPGDEEARR